MGRSNSVLGLVYSAKAGVGVAPLPIALTTAELRHTPRVAAFFDFIIEEIETLRPIITG